MNRSLLKRATKDDSSPTPGWMYHSIIKMSNQSDSISKRVRDWLFRRLKVQSPFVKRKVLLVIKNICENGDANFAIHISEQDSVLKELVGYRGKKDELHGDAFNNSVRTAAKEAIASIYKRIETHQRAPKIPKRASPVANSNNPARNTNIFEDRFAGFGSSGNSMKKTEEPSFSGGIGEKNLYLGISSGDEKCQKNKFRIALGIKNKCQCSTCRSERASNRYGPGIGMNEDGKGLVDNELESTSGYGASDRVGNLPSSKTDTFNRYIPPELTNADDEFVMRRKKKKENEISMPSITEQRLVKKLCGGTQSSRVSSSVLEKFVENCFHVDGEVVSELLEEALGDSNWKVRYKALSGLEAVIKEENQKIRKYFRNNPQSLRTCLESNQKALKHKTVSILKLLGIGGIKYSELDDDSPQKKALSRETVSEQKEDSGLLGFFEEEKKEEAKRSEGFVDAFSASASMFDGMDLEPNNKVHSKEDKLLSFFSDSAPSSNDPPPGKVNYEFGMQKIMEKVEETRNRSKKKILDVFSMDDLLTSSSPTVSKVQKSPVVSKNFSPMRMNQSPMYVREPTFYEKSPIQQHVQKPEKSQEFNLIDDTDLLQMQPRTRMRVKKEKQMKPETKKKDAFSVISEELLTTENVFD